jgi:multiple sugar transport system substrate-binding protein
MVLGALVASVLFAAVAGCSSTGGSSNSGSVTLNFLHTKNADPTWAKAISAFEKANPGVTIKETETSFDDLNSQIQARLSVKDDTIDVYTVDGPRLANSAAQGFLADLSSYKSDIVSQTGSSAADSITYAGKQYAFPQWTSTNLMFYNKSVLKAAGVADPSADPASRQTWEDIVANGKKAQAAGTKYAVGFEQVDRYYQLQPLFESAGGGSGLTGKGNLTPAITTPEWEKTASWYGNLFSSGLSPRGIPVEQMPDQFTSGNIAYFVGGPWNYPAFAKSGVDFGVAPFPYFDGGKKVTTSTSWTVGVSAFSAHKDIAEKFAKYITLDPKGANLVYPEGLPIQKDSLTSYLADLTAKGGRDADLAGIIKYEVASTGVARPTSVGYVDFETTMNKAFADIRNGTDAKTSLDGASTQLTTQFARYK